MTQTVDGKDAQRTAREVMSGGVAVAGGVVARLDNPHSLAAKLPELPYHSEDDFLRKEEAYYRNRALAWDDFVDVLRRAC